MRNINLGLVPEAEDEVRLDGYLLRADEVDGLVSSRSSPDRRRKRVPKTPRSRETLLKSSQRRASRAARLVSLTCRPLSQHPGGEEDEHATP